jgi:hypothetical protein
MSKTIFLSAVSCEFDGLRLRLAEVCARTQRLHVRHEAFFVQHGVPTLRMLDEEIEKSNLVVHLIGGEFGSVPPGDQVTDLLRRHPDFEKQFPEVAARARLNEISYTQWEAWLGLYFQSQPGRSFAAPTSASSAGCATPGAVARNNRRGRMNCPASREVYPRGFRLKSLGEFACGSSMAPIFLPRRCRLRNTLGSVDFAIQPVLTGDGKPRG